MSQKKTASKLIKIAREAKTDIEKTIFFRTTYRFKKRGTKIY